MQVLKNFALWSPLPEVPEIAIARDFYLYLICIILKALTVRNSHLKS